MALTAGTILIENILMTIRTFIFLANDLSGLCMVVGFHGNVSTLFDSSARPRKLIAELGSERTWSSNDCCEHERTREPRDASGDEARDGLDEVAEYRNVGGQEPGAGDQLGLQVGGDPQEFHEKALKQ